MSIQTDFLEKCIKALEKALQHLDKKEQTEIDYEIYRSASIKEFEIILEQSGKLLKKALRPYFHSNREADQLIFKDIFRNAAKYGLITADESERWLKYRDNRNATAHDYGAEFAEDTLALLPQFVVDANKLVKTIKQASNATS